MSKIKKDLNFLKESARVRTINSTLSANILAFRKKKGFSQSELAQQLGVTFQAVSKWETARSAPDISLLPRMAEIFDCSIDELLKNEQA